MYITCPNCNFQRSVDENQIPASATVVTCPRCENKFRFRNLDTGAFLPEICSELSHEEQKKSTVKEPLFETSIYPDEHEKTTDDVHSEQTIQNEEENLAQENNQKEMMNTFGEDKEPMEEEELTKKSTPQDNSFIEPETENVKNSRLEMMTDDVPWEHPERYGVIGSLFQTIARVLFKAPMFFSTIHSHSSMLRPATFYALLYLFQTLCLQMWLSTILNSLDNVVQSPVMQESLYQFSAPITIFLSPFLAIFQLLFYSAFLYLAIRITNPDKADYNLTLRVIAYAYAPTILSIVPYFGPMVGLIWFICNIFIGIKYAFGLTWQRTFLALSPIFILWLFFIASSFSHLFV